MKVYVFGNPDVAEDNFVYEVVRRLDGKIPNLEFIDVKPGQDLPFAGEDKVTLMDAVEGIDKVGLISESALDKLVLKRSISVHDWDLGFQLKYLKKLGRLGKVTIIGLPKDKMPDYRRIQSILRKLVEQEMQGS